MNETPGYTVRPHIHIQHNIVRSDDVHDPDISKQIHGEVVVVLLPPSNDE